MSIALFCASAHSGVRIALRILLFMSSVYIETLELCRSFDVTDSYLAHPPFVYRLDGHTPYVLNYFFPRD
jgi:hypothetical protein